MTSVKEKSELPDSNRFQSPPSERRKRKGVIYIDLNSDKEQTECSEQASLVDLTSDKEQTECSEKASVVSGIKRWKGRRGLKQIETKTNP